ncbi:MAG TPA: transcriptional regulator [Acidimicrobiales bacterium]|nr:transcriptional regulator [Acidimicrobiales bacterium]
MSNDDLDTVSALAEPTRRGLYDHVVAQHDWVSRDEAAAALGLRKGITAHHLDRLEADGLLISDHQRRNGRTGPGAGRPSKVYRRAAEDFEVSLPPRRYDLAGRVLSVAADRARNDGITIDDAIDEAARAEGVRVGDGAKQRAGDDPTPEEQRAALFHELRADGFEPVTGDDDVTVLHNCPFHELSATHTELICGMNHTMLTAAVECCGDTGLEARLEPHAGTCCVRFQRAAPTG